MGQLRTITCDVKGCEERYTEEFDGAGFPGWGHIGGLRDDVTGSTTAYLCPLHLQKVAEILRGD